MGAYQALAEHDLAVPDDVAVISFDGSDLAELAAAPAHLAGAAVQRDGNPRRRDPDGLRPRGARRASSQAALGAAAAGEPRCDVRRSTGEFVWDFWTAYDEAHGRAPPVLPARARPRSATPSCDTATHASAMPSPPTCGTWTRLPDPLPATAGRRRSTTWRPWTGCAVRGEDAWWMFTTGLARSDDGRVQRIGAATLRPTSRPGPGPGWCSSADPAHYQLSSDELGRGGVARPVGGARRATGAGTCTSPPGTRAATPGCGVVGHAVSDDLVAWEVQPPLSSPTGLFEWLEVIQVVRVEGRWVLLFSCLSDRDARSSRGCRRGLVGPGRRARGRRWTWPPRCGSPTSAVRRQGGPPRGCGVLHGVPQPGPDGSFVGGLTDPVPVTWRADGRGLDVGVGLRGTRSVSGVTYNGSSGTFLPVRR